MNLGLQLSTGNAFDVQRCPSTKRLLHLWKYNPSPSPVTLHFSLSHFKMVCSGNSRETNVWKRAPRDIPKNSMLFPGRSQPHICEKVNPRKDCKHPCGTRVPFVNTLLLIYDVQPVDCYVYFGGPIGQRALLHRWRRCVWYVYLCGEHVGTIWVRICAHQARPHECTEYRLWTNPNRPHSHQRGVYSAALAHVLL